MLEDFRGSIKGAVHLGTAPWPMTMDLLESGEVRVKPGFAGGRRRSGQANATVVCDGVGSL